MDELTIFGMVIGAIMGALGGLAIGRCRGRPEAGLWLGLLLGPLGWLILIVGPDHRPKCPECGGVVVKGARRCKNCGQALAELRSEPLSHVEELRCEKCTEKFPSRYWFHDEGRATRRVCVECKKTMSREALAAFLETGYEGEVSLLGEEIVISEKRIRRRPFPDLDPPPSRSEDAE